MWFCTGACGRAGAAGRSGRRWSSSRTTSTPIPWGWATLGGHLQKSWPTISRQKVYIWFGAIEHPLTMRLMLAYGADGVMVDDLAALAEVLGGKTKAMRRSVSRRGADAGGAH